MRLVYGKTNRMWLPRLLLIIDDAVAIFVVTFLGLQFHQADAGLWERLPFTFVPFYATWLLAAAALQLYDPQRAKDFRQLWRVPVAAAVVTLPAAALRSVWLGTPVAPIFVVVMGLAIAIGLLISRSIYIFSFGRYWQQHG